MNSTFVSTADRANAATFSTGAAAYAAARPTYPEPLFDWLAAQSPGRHHAWDAGCGNGQATVALAQRFARVTANDSAAEQIAQAPACPHVAWHVAPAEAMVFDPCSLDLVTVATAVHWFDLERFYPVVRAALKPRGLFCAFGYGVVQLEPALHAAMQAAFAPIKPYWSDGNRRLWRGYETLPLPYAAIAAPRFLIELDWTHEQFLAYASTWSAVKRHDADRGADIIASAREVMAPAWGGATRRVTMPVALRAARKDAE